MRKPQLPPENWTTAVLMAESAGVDRKAFRRQLRAAKLPWHSLNDRWTAQIGSAEHRDMQRVLAKLR